MDKTESYTLPINKFLLNVAHITYFRPPNELMWTNIWCELMFD